MPKKLPAPELRQKCIDAGLNGIANFIAYRESMAQHVTFNYQPTDVHGRRRNLDEYLTEVLEQGAGPSFDNLVYIDLIALQLVSSCMETVDVQFTVQ